MEKAFAYICADAEATPRLLRRYCRKVYELGYVPICPKLSEVQYLQPDNPDEKRVFHSISHQNDLMEGKGDYSYGKFWAAPSAALSA